MINKSDKATAKKLCIFIALSLALSLLPALIIYLTAGFESKAITVYSVLMPFTPAAAALLTRLISKEGMEDSMLVPKFSGKGKYYILAVLLPIVCLILQIVIFSAAYIESFDLSLRIRFLGVTKTEWFSTLFYQIGIGLTACVLMLGEELGWQDYLYPKMQRVFGKPITLIAGGIVVGIWNIPLVVSGQYFGNVKDKAAAIVLAALICILTEAICQQLTESSKSVITAAIFRSVIHFSSPAFLSLITLEQRKITDLFKFHAPQLAALTAAVIFCLVFVGRKNKLAKQA